MWLKLVELALGIAAAVAGWFEARSRRAEEKAARKAAHAQQQAGVNAQAAAQTAEVLHEVAVAEDARLGVEAELHHDPDRLREPDEFTRRD